MIAVITGDIINSQSQSPQKVIALLTNYLNKFGTSPKFWEIYRGDEFQLKLPEPESALLTSIYFKSLLKSLMGLDVRIGIGLGIENYNAKKITQSNGSAYINSGRVFEQSKTNKTNLIIKSDSSSFDTAINLMLQLALTFMDNWTPTSAATVGYVLENPGKSQQEIAEELKVSQSTVSQRLNRANFNLILKLNDYFKAELKTLKI